MGLETFSDVAEAFGGAPEAEGGVRDIEDLFAVGERVPTVAEAVGGVTLLHFLQLAEAVTDRLDLGAGQVAGAVRDREAAFGGAVNEVGGGGQVEGQLRL